MSSDATDTAMGSPSFNDGVDLPPFADERVGHVHKVPAGGYHLELDISNGNAALLPIDETSPTSPYWAIKVPRWSTAMSQ